MKLYSFFVYDFRNLSSMDVETDKPILHLVFGAGIVRSFAVLCLIDMNSHRWETDKRRSFSLFRAACSCRRRRRSSSDCGNIRGISLLSVGGNILARLMLNRLLTHAAEVLLPETQCGFRLDGNLFKQRRLNSQSKTTVTHSYELQYADDTALVSHTADGLQKLLDG